MRRSALPLALLLAALASTAATAAGVEHTWVEYGDGGAAVARAITTGACPELTIGASERLAMREHAAPDRAFPVRVCEARVPHDATSAAVDGHALPLAPAQIKRIAVLGDTGCRVEGPLMQACRDASEWPFPVIAKEIADRKPDLIVHVGDYYYRESPCIAPGCFGTPYGDHWNAWDADFFAPAQPMLDVAPIVAVRGNHESCARGGAGWFFLLSLRADAACTEHEPAALIPLGEDLALLVVDSSHATDNRVDAVDADLLRHDFARIEGTHGAIWIATHRPLWALDGGIFGGTNPINKTLEAAANGRGLRASLILSGHIHLFEALRFADDRAPQFVVGVGGDMLSESPRTTVGTPIDGTTVAAATVRHGFGYALIDRDRNDLTAYDTAAREVYHCTLDRATFGCAEVR